VNKTNYNPVWYAFYDLQPGNGEGTILTNPESTRDRNQAGVAGTAPLPREGTYTPELILQQLLVYLLNGFTNQHLHV